MTEEDRKSQSNAPFPEQDPAPAAEQPATEQPAAVAASDAGTERTKVERKPQSFTEYDVEKLDEIVERRDHERLKEEFGGPLGLVDVFKTNKADGINMATYEARREQFGVNELKKKDPPTFLEFLAEAFSDKVIIILVVAAIVSIIFGMTLENPHTKEVERESGWIEGVAIIISVLIVTLVGSINNYQKAKKFEEMEKEQSMKSIEVIREGVDKTVMTNELVPGDLMKIVVGMEITCDAVVIAPQGLKMDEAAVTGEADLIAKDIEHDCFVLSGTAVAEGDAICMVIAIGMESFQGRLKGALDQETPETPLEAHLSELADQIGMFGLGGAVLLIVALSLKEVIINSTQDGRTWSPVPFLNFLLIAVALVAVAIPEGLPLAVTIALAFAMKAMMREQCMVRVLASCETMGAATAVCSDKTGTLTENKMTVVQGLICEKEFIIDGRGIQRRNDDVQEVDGQQPNGMNLSNPAIELFCRAVAVNSTAGETQRDGETVWTGNKTEQGMLQFFSSLGRDYKEIRAANSDTFSYPFSSAKKRMTSLARTAAGAQTADLYCKGASETILENCQKMFNAAGDIVDLTSETRALYDAIIIDMAKQGNRTIGIARSLAPIAVPADSFPEDDPTDEAQLVWIGVVGIQDPMRPEVPRAVAVCHSAGITVRMVTGDNIHTAKAIAAKCGLYEDDGFCIAMTGPEFRRMAEEDKDQLMELLPRLRVLARSSPSDKHTLVGLLQDQGEVVAVTGDGTNDAPALKLANVGFAMNSGTDIAKGACAMILLDDNFASVVTAIRWGRSVNDNVKKFLQFQLAINVAGVLLTIIGSLASETSKEPFNPVQLLWLNMIMDTLAALSLATELPEDASLERPPVYLQAPLITNRMRVFIVTHAAFQVLIILLILFLGHRWFETVDDPDRCNNVLTQADRDHCFAKCEEAGGHLDGKFCQQGRVHSTMVFNIFIWFQVFNIINARKIYGEMNPLEGAFTRSRSLIVIFLIIAALQAIAVEFTGDFMEVTGLTAREWGICIGFGALEIVVGILVRFIPVRDKVPKEIIAREARFAELREKYTRKPETGAVQEGTAVVDADKPQQLAAAPAETHAADESAQEKTA